MTSGADPPRALILHERRLVAEVLAVALSPGLLCETALDPASPTDVTAFDVVLLSQQLMSVTRTGPPWPPVLVVADGAATDSLAMAHARQMGAHGWIPLDASLNAVLHVVVEVLAGRQVFPRVPVPRRPSGGTDANPHPVRRAAGAEALTPRECDVLFLMSTGQTTPLIAHSLSLSPNTVRNHRQHLMHKLGVRSAAAAVSVFLCPPRTREESPPQPR